MTIQLPEELEHFIQAKVQSGRFASEDEAVVEAVRRYKQWEQEEAPTTPAEAAPTPKRKHLSEVFEAIRQGVPREEWDKLPVDGAEQHDHYIYGLPKRL